MTSRVRDLGEFELIDRLLAALPEGVRGTETVFGAGDDCAWWRSDDGDTVVTADALVEGNHFRLDWTDWASLGHKMVAVNLSDIASMGATPKVLIFTLALTGNEQVDDLEEMYRGAGELAHTYGAVIAGGDIVRTRGPLVMSVTAIGEQPAGIPPMLRSNAQVGDVVLVSGTLGASAAGVKLLERGETTASTAGLLVGAQLRPAPRVSLGQMLLHHGVRCCMDVSDGLSGDLPKILRASGVGAEIRLGHIPALPALRALFPEEWHELALHGGEDYELLFTARPELVDDLIANAPGVGATLTPIGVITAEPSLKYLDVNDHPVDVFPAAWDHFGGQEIGE